MNQITFKGERELAIDTLKLFKEYLAIDNQIRQLSSSDKITEAVGLGIGTKPCESNWAFDRSEQKYTELMDLNKQEFEDNIKIGGQHLDNDEIIAPVVLSIIAILTLFGLRPRLME